MSMGCLEPILVYTFQVSRDMLYISQLGVQKQHAVYLSTWCTETTCCIFLNLVYRNNMLYVSQLGVQKQHA